jgi:5'(3')-deoxyribonucleotidase
MLYIKEPKSNIDNKSHYYVGKKILTSLSALGTPLEELSIKQNISITQSKDTAKKVYEQTVDKIETRYKEKPTVKSTNIGDKGGLVRVNFNRTDQIMCLDNYFVHTILFDTNNNKDINNYTRKIEKNIKSI